MPRRVTRLDGSAGLVEPDPRKERVEVAGVGEQERMDDFSTPVGELDPEAVPVGTTPMHGAGRAEAAEVQAQRAAAADALRAVAVGSNRTRSTRRLRMAPALKVSTCAGPTDESCETMRGQSPSSAAHTSRPSSLWLRLTACTPGVTGLRQCGRGSKSACSRAVARAAQHRQAGSQMSADRWPDGGDGLRSGWFMTTRSCTIQSRSAPAGLLRECRALLPRVLWKVKDREQRSCRAPVLELDRAFPR